jgi:hypothetical protein
MEDVQYINGNKKTLIAFILFWACWMLIGIMVKQYIEMRHEEIKQIQDAAIAMKELKSVHLWTIVVPGTLLFTISTALNFYIGLMTLKQKQYPPTGIAMPFRTELVKGEKSKKHGYGYMFAAGLSLITAFLNFMFWVYIYGI